MKQSQLVTLGIVAAAATAFVGVAGPSGSSQRDCVDSKGNKASDQACSQAAGHGAYGSGYYYRYRNSDPNGRTSFVDPANSGAVSSADSAHGVSRGGFGSEGGSHSSGS